MSVDEMLKLALQGISVAVPVGVFLYGILSAAFKAQNEKLDKHGDKIDAVAKSVQDVRETAIAQGKDVETLKRDIHEHSSLDDTRFSRTDGELTGIRLTLAKIDGKLSGLPTKTGHLIGDQE